MMTAVKLPLYQDGCNAYVKDDGKMVPVLSTNMGNCWNQDDQRDFCKYLVKTTNNFDKALDVLNNLLNDCINFDDGSLTNSIQRDASKFLKDMGRKL